MEARDTILSNCQECVCASLKCNKPHFRSKLIAFSIYFFSKNYLHILVWVFVVNAKCP